MALFYPKSVARLIEEFNHLPGIGRRSAERLAFHVLASPREQAMGLALAIHEVKNSLRACSICFNVADADRCPICADTNRDPDIICVVELPRDVIAIEKCAEYRGIYHILQGRLDPLENITPADLRITELFARLERDTITEIILALNPTTAGDATTAYLTTELRARFPQLKISALARGLTSGCEIEAAAQSSLTAAFLGRTRL